MRSSPTKKYCIPQICLLVPTRSVVFPNPRTSTFVPNGCFTLHTQRMSGTPVAMSQTIAWKICVWGRGSTSIGITQQRRDGGSRKGGRTANKMTGRLAPSHAPYWLYASAGIPRDGWRVSRRLPPAVLTGQGERTMTKARRAGARW
jgi:hypothetical protein